MVATKKLQTQINSWNKQQQEELLFHKKIKWRLYPPRSPNLIEVSDRLNWSCESLKISVLGNKNLNYEILNKNFEEKTFKANYHPQATAPKALKMLSVLRSLNIVFFGRVNKSALF